MSKTSRCLVDKFLNQIYKLTMMKIEKLKKQFF